MELIKLGIMDADRIAPLVAAFRTQLKSYKGIKSQPDIEAGKEEILEYLESGFPTYAVEDSGAFVGYIVHIHLLERHVNMGTFGVLAGDG